MNKRQPPTKETTADTIKFEVVVLKAPEVDFPVFVVLLMVVVLLVVLFVVFVAFKRAWQPRVKTEATV